mmetsp:Transcript_21870/g.57943  ORF Transcript_21870/g.57943 Transcript_21870/m.57943 type:complete len:201 (+) Transcript_21870:459-1061(+)
MYTTVASDVAIQMQMIRSATGRTQLSPELSIATAAFMHKWVTASSRPNEAGYTTPMTLSSQSGASRCGSSMTGSGPAFSPTHLFSRDRWPHWKRTGYRRSCTPMATMVDSTAPHRSKSQQSPTGRPSRSSISVGVNSVSASVAILTIHMMTPTKIMTLPVTFGGVRSSPSRRRAKTKLKRINVAKTPESSESGANNCATA